MSLCENSNDGRPCRDEDGETCAQCQSSQDADMRYWKRLWDAATPEERDPKNWRAPAR